jgi:hypothetical protein
MSNNWQEPTNPDAGFLPPPPAAPMPPASFLPPPPPPPAAAPSMQIAPPAAIPSSHALFAPYSSAAVPLVADDPLPVYVAPVAAKRGRGKRLGAIAAGVMLLGGAGTAIAIRSNADSGAASPEAAVQSMMNSIEAGDWLGAMETMPSGERQFYVKVAEKSISEAKRLGFLAEAGSARKVSGIKIDFKDITMQSLTVNDRVARVTITGGSVTSDITASELPIGDVLSKLMGRGNATLTDLHNEQTITPDDDSSKGFIGTVKDDDGWHVSLMYTAAENARGRKAMPKVAIAAKGAASPEKAVEEMVQAGLSADMNRVIELVDPQEGAVFHDYGQLLVDAVSENEIGTTDWPKVEEMQLTSAPGDWGTEVGLKKLVVVSTNSDDGSKDKVTFEQTGDCTSITNETDGEEMDTQRFCSTDVQDMFLGRDNGECDDGDQDCARANVAQDVMRAMTNRAAANPYQSGIVTRQVDGKWYVSPSSTVAAAIFRLIKLVERSDIEKILNA